VFREDAIGPCRLCGSDGPLLDSHIFPKAAYKRILEGPDVEVPERAPVKITRDASVLTNSQMRERLLCAACEGRFNKWETYALPVMSQGDGSFPWLVAVTPFQGQVSDSAGVDVEALGFFAASLFWRLSITRLTSLTLGQYEDPFRRYLLGEAGFPENARLVLTLIDHSRVSWGRVDRLLGFNKPKREQGYTRQQLKILGVDMKLYVGQHIPRALDELCFARTKRVMVRPADDFAKEMAPQLGASPPKGSLALRDALSGPCARLPSRGERASTRRTATQPH
jgi:hypothetical protein